MKPQYYRITTNRGQPASPYTVPPPSTSNETHPGYRTHRFQGNHNLANLTKLHYWLQTNTPGAFQENPDYLPLHARLAHHFQASQPIHSRSRCYTLAADLLRRQPWLLTKTYPPPEPTRPVHSEHRPYLQPLHTEVNHPRPGILRRPAATRRRPAATRRRPAATPPPTGATPLPAPQPVTVEVGNYHPISQLLPTSVRKHHGTVLTKGPYLGQQHGTGPSIQSQSGRLPVVSQPQPNQADVKVIPDKQGAQQDAVANKRKINVTKSDVIANDPECAEFDPQYAHLYQLALANDQCISVIYQLVEGCLGISQFNQILDEFEKSDGNQRGG